MRFMTCPLPFREKVFATKEKFDLTFEATSQRFDIPIRPLFRWQQKIAPCVTRDKPATKIDMDALAQHVDDYPDAYLHERAAVKPSSILMKVALLTICQERMAIQLKESVVMASITGMLRVARMLSVPL